MPALPQGNRGAGAGAAAWSAAGGGCPRDAESLPAESGRLRSKTCAAGLTCSGGGI
jgi:hypothetical protein